MLVRPIDELSVRHVSGSGTDDYLVTSIVRRIEPIGVQFEEQFEKDKSDTFVAIDERVVLYDSEGIHRTQFRNTWFSIGCVIARPLQR